MRAILSIILLIPSFCFPQKILLHDLKAEKTLTWYSDQDSFCVKFDRKTYLEFIEKDTSLITVFPRIRTLIESEIKDISLDTIFKIADRALSHDNWNKNILYDDFIMSSLDNGDAIVVDMETNKRVKLIRRKKSYYKSREMLVEYTSEKKLIFSHRYFTVHL